MATVEDLVTNDDPSVGLCTIEGTEHDYRAYTRPPTYPGGPSRTYWRCVWCHGVSCGDYGEADGCIEPHHHHGDHRTRSGVTWPLGGDRPAPSGEAAEPTTTNRGKS